MTAAARQHRYRQRRRAGVFIVPVEADAELIAALVDARFLHRDDADDPEAVKVAIERLHAFLKRRACEL